MPIAEIRLGAIHHIDRKHEFGVIRTHENERLSFRYSGWRQNVTMLSERVNGLPAREEIEQLMRVGKRVFFTTANPNSLSPSVRTWTYSTACYLRMMIELVPNEPRVFWTGDDPSELQKMHPRQFGDKSSDGSFQLELDGETVADWLRLHRTSLTDPREVELLWHSDAKSAWFEELQGEVWQRCPDPRPQPKNRFPFHNLPKRRGGIPRY